MHPAHWQKLKEIVADALEVPPDERPAFLLRACDGDASLRAGAESMLAQSGDRVESFADDVTSMLSSAAGDSHRGARLGSYEIIREIGRGGMGAVYLARRADEAFEKEVAIKLLKRGTDTDEVLRRFQSERQILARLEHPNIARLLDGGTTSDGLPYFVMEYVNGVRITEFCSAQNLNISARVELFLKVCAAVQFAHQNLVIHRDLKPGNILITPEGEPKLLDFGIAKLVTPEMEFAQMTAAEQQRFTPAYASPEQVRGEPVTTVSDVYALGALLYELLSGKPPHRFSVPHPSATELFRVIVEAEPPRASAAADEPELRRQLRGDLDNILETALRKEPKRRYSGITAFNDDLRRYLAQRPVRARPATFSYRASKFVARNKVSLAAAVVVCIAGITGATAYVIETRRTAYHAQREAAHFRDVRKLANLFIFKYHDGIAAVPGLTELRNELVKDALAYLNNLGSTDDPELLREIAAAYKRVADVQGGVFSIATNTRTISGANLGDTAGALENYTKSLEIRQRLAQTNPRSEEGQRELGEIYVCLGQANVVAGNAGDAARHFRHAIEVWQAVLQKAPGDKLARSELRVSYAALAQPLALQPLNLGDIDGALEALGQSIRLGETLVADEPDNVGYRQGLAVSYGDSSRLSLNSGKVAEAAEYSRKALAIGQSLLKENPADPLLRREVAVQHRNAGTPLLQMGENVAARAHFQQAVSIFEQLAKEDPSDARTRRSSAFAYRDLAEAFGATGSRAEAETNFKTALRIFEELGEKDAKNAIVLAQQVITHAKMSRFFADGDQLAAATGSAQSSVDLAESLVSANPKDLSARKSLAEAYAQLGRCHALSGEQQTEQWPRARASFEKAAEIWSDIAAQGNLTEPEAKKRAEVAAQVARYEVATEQPPQTK